MQPLAIPGLYCWSIWQPERNVFFNSHFIKRPDGNVVIDPLDLSPDDAKAIESMGGVALVAITNRDHERKSRELAARFGATIAASEGDAPLLSGPVDRIVRDGESLFGGASVIQFEGLKSPGEIAVHLQEHRAAIVGDALWGDPAGSLRLLPDEKLTDAKKAVLSLRKLWALRLEVLLVGDGASIFGDADRIIGDCLQSRSDVFVNRINIDELDGRAFSEKNGRYEGTYREIGFLIGARKLGYQLTTLPPGKRFCPLHSHAVEEEMFLIWEGEGTIRTPRGEYTCRRGDVIAFPVGDRGAHQLINTSSAPCTVLMLGATEDNEVCHYPDSKKVFVRSQGLLLRSEPSLDYFEGE